MNLNRFPRLPLALAVLWPTLAFSQVQDTNAARSREETSVHQSSDERQARDWGLDAGEWIRYRQLMRGPLGIHSPSLDPLTALGIEARTDEERIRYAELQARTEALRVEKLLAYQRAYDAAWRRLFPGTPRVDLSAAGDSGPEKDRGQRLAVFVRADCPPCEARVRQLQAAGTPFDLYLVGSHDDDDALRRWARRAGIDPAKVRSRAITLNHDGGRWNALGLSGELPAVAREVDGQWRRQ